MMMFESHRLSDQSALSAVCGLAQGTRVLTMQGELPVEYLTAGDRIITRSGPRKLLSVALAQADAPMIRVSASTIGVEQPEEDVIVSADSLLRITDWRAQALAGQPQAMIAVTRLVDGEFIRPEPAGAHRLWQLVLDGPAVIYAGGLEIGVQPVLAAA